MKKQEIPKVVADVLKEVSEKIKEFNLSSDFKLVAKSSDDFLLKIFPKGYEELFFQINGFLLKGENEKSKKNIAFYHIVLNFDSFISIQLALQQIGISNSTFDTDRNYAIYTLGQYLKTINYLYSELNSYEKTTLNLSEIFDLEDDEEEILPPNQIILNQQIRFYLTVLNN